MWKLGSILAVLAVLGISACLPEDRPIPPGVYAEPSGEEYLAVGPTTIRLHVSYRAVGTPDDGFVDGEYTYEVRRNGVVHLHMTSNNFDIAEFNWYDWYWREGRVLRVERETGAQTWFAAAGAGR